MGCLVPGHTVRVVRWCGPIDERGKVEELSMVYAMDNDNMVELARLQREYMEEDTLQDGELCRNARVRSKDEGSVDLSRKSRVERTQEEEGINGDAVVGQHPHAAVGGDNNIPEDPV